MIIIGFLFNLMILMGINIGFGIGSRSIYRTLIMSLYYVLIPIFFYLSIIITFSERGLTHIIPFLISLMYIGLNLVFYRRESFLGIMKILVISFPFFFIYFLHYKKPDPDKLTKLIIMIFYISLTFAVLQLLTRRTTHVGRINGIFQGYNSYSAFLVTCLPLFWKDKKKYVITLFLILFTKSATMLLISLGITFLHIRKRWFIITITTSVLLGIIYYNNFYVEDASNPMYKILSLITYEDIYNPDFYYDLAELDHSSELESIDSSLVSGFNRLVQISKVLLKMDSIPRVLFGNETPHVVEGNILTIISFFGLVGFIPTLFIIYFYFLKPVENKELKLVTIVIMIGSTFALPILAFPFSTIFVIINMYLWRYI